MQIVTEGNDLEGIEPSKSFRNAEDSVPYGTLEESDKLQLIPSKRIVPVGSSTGMEIVSYSAGGWIFFSICARAVFIFS